MSDYTFVWANHQPHWNIQGNLIGPQQLRHIIWNQVNTILSVSRKNQIATYHSPQDLEHDAERGKVFSDPPAVKQFLQEADVECAAYRKLFQEMKSTDYATISNEELFNLFKQLLNCYARILSYFRATQVQGTQHVVQELHNHFPEKEVLLLLNPVEVDEVGLEHMDWQKILQEEISESTLISHAQQYPWLVAAHYTMPDVLETLQMRYKLDQKSIKKSLVHEKEKLRAQQEKILAGKPHLTEKVSLLQQLSLNRMKVKSCWGGSDFYLIHLMEEISKRTGESVHDLTKLYLLEDMEALILRGIPLSAQEKENRTNCFVGLWKGGELTFSSGDEAEQVAKRELGELYETEARQEISGTPANPGKVQGMVFVLHANNVQQMREARNSFTKGQILVTEMTQPNIMDIAARAGAIVTDEGGMLSHAAVISRELKIPCIVGTHVGTQVFKDGDLVEVDAEKGVVRKIS